MKIDRRILVLHHSGSSMTTLTELCDPDEVASVLAKIDASERDSFGGSFHRALTRAGDGHRRSRNGIETIDLTRRDQARTLKNSIRARHLTA